MINDKSIDAAPAFAIRDADIYFLFTVKKISQRKIGINYGLSEKWVKEIVGKQKRIRDKIK